jgi:CDP-6-deoxy-D-xylo-4-hexulose-3-dehydrase
LCNIADSNNILLIEDNCESLGSKVENKLLGSFGIAATFSTFVGHHISTIEGGLTVTDSPELDEMLKIVRAHGWSRNLDETARSRLRKEYSVDPFYDLYSFYFSAFNLRPTEINGFLGSFALKYLDEIIDARESNYLKYKNVTKNCSSIWHYSLDHMTKVSNFAYPIIFKKTADSVRARKEFNSRGVEVRPIVGGNIAKQPFMVNFKTKHQLVNADIIHTNGVYLPNNPDLTEDDMRYLCDTFSDIVG